MVPKEQCNFNKLRRSDTQQLIFDIDSVFFKIPSIPT